MDERELRVAIQHYYEEGSSLWVADDTYKR